MPLTKINDEVFMAEGPIARVGPDDVAFLKRQAALNQRRRARICAHRGPSDLLHEMIIALTSACYIRPHRHLGRSESFHVIEGIVDIVIYSDTGRMIDVIPLGDHSSGRQFYYRLESDKFHGLIIQSDTLVFHEVTNGPFQPDRSQLASFAPDERDPVGVATFNAAARAEASRFQLADPRGRAS